MSRRGWLSVPVGPRGSVARLPLGPAWLSEVKRSNRKVRKLTADERAFFVLPAEADERADERSLDRFVLGALFATLVLPAIVASVAMIALG